MPLESPVTAHALIAALREQIERTLCPLLPQGGRVALIDFPSYANVGDSAIWLGESAFLEETGHDVVYRCDCRDYSREHLARRIGGGVILLSGGGNLGDLYPANQDLRERVITDFPANPIVQLPQTIHFASREHLARARRVFDGHPNLTLLLRDLRSMEVAGNEFGARTRLAPDMAFCLGPLASGAAPARDLLCLLREERESMGAAAAARARGLDVHDWRDEQPGTLTRAFSVIDRWSRRSPQRLAGLRQSLWKYGGARIARGRLARGCQLLATGRVVMTDRLHGHILSLLVGRPHVVLDNSYGKIGAFVETWTGRCELTHTAESLDEGLRIAASLAPGAA